MTRKVSVDSVSDASADDLLRFLYDLGFRKPSGWGWSIAVAFAAVPGWLAVVSLIEGNNVSGAVFAAMCGLIVGLRVYLLRKMGLYAFDTRKAPADKHTMAIDIDA